MFGHRSTSNNEIVSVAFVIRVTLTNAFVIVRDAVGVGPALEIVANVKAFGQILDFDALGSERTVLVLETLSRGLTATVVRIANGSMATVTLVRSTSVFARGTGSTRRFGATVDQVTTRLRVSRVAWLTGADLSVSLGRADGVLTTRIVCQTGYSADVHFANLLVRAVAVGGALDRLAANLVAVGLAEEACLARTVSQVIVDSALGVATASDQIARFLTLSLAHVVVHASLVVLAIVIRQTSQFLHAYVVRAVLVVRTGRVVPAGRVAETFDAKLVTDAVPRAGAQGRAYSTVARRADRALLVELAVLNRSAAEVWISRSAGLACADKAVVERLAVGPDSACVWYGARIDALAIVTGARGTALAVVAALVMHALHSRIPGSLACALTDGHVIAHLALGIAAASPDDGAGVSASVVNAGCRVRTVRVGEAVPGLFAALLERVANQTTGTVATVRSVAVLTAVIGEARVNIFPNVARDNIIRIFSTYSAVAWQGFCRHSLTSTHTAPTRWNPS